MLGTKQGALVLLSVFVLGLSVSAQAQTLNIKVEHQGVLSSQLPQTYVPQWDISLSHTLAKYPKLSLTGWALVYFLPEFRGGAEVVLCGPDVSQNHWFRATAGIESTGWYWLWFPGLVFVGSVEPRGR